MKCRAVILAAGKGTRMRTELPKCAYPLLRKPMIRYLVDALKQSESVQEIIVVVGHKKEIFETMLEGEVTFAHQAEQLGTGHAVLCARPAFQDLEGCTLILPGDMPLLSASLIEDLVRVHQSSHTDLTVMTTDMEDPTGYGRILRNHAGLLKRIVEEKDADASLRAIKEINSGLYCVRTEALFQALSSLSNQNAQGEYYLTDIVEHIANKGSAIAYKAPRSDCLLGVNDLYSLSLAEAFLRMRINKQYMLQGVSMINPETITIGEEVEIEEGVVLHPNTYITGHSIIRKDAIVGPNTEVHNSTLGERVHARHSLIYDSIVEADTVVGPFAHLRDRAHIGTHNRIGNFVEVKNSTTLHNTKASHLAYIGDATMGENVNFGCGAITVNYDGVHKNRTIIGNNVFIGCNTNLIAPVQLEDDSYTAAGSTVTKLVPKGTLAIARANQVNKENYVENYFKKQNGKKTEK